MNPGRFVNEERVDLDLDAAFPRPEDDDGWSVSGEALAEHMAGLLELSDQIVNPTKLRRDIIERERRAPTLLGEGVAMPHVRTLQARKLVMAVGVSREGLPMNGPDDEPVRLVIAFAGPTYDDKQFMHLEKRLAERILEDGWVERVLDASSAGEVVRAMGQ